MNRPRPLILLTVLLALLGALAFLQYHWLVQISVSEKEQAQKRLQNDTEHFAQDFNQTIQAVYFPFQISASENWQNDFVSQYQSWLSNAENPELVKDFFYTDERGEKLKFDKLTLKFVEAQFSDDFQTLKTDFKPIDEKNLILRMPVYVSPEKTKIFKILTENISPKIEGKEDGEVQIKRTVEMPKAAAYLLIALDADFLKNKVLANLNEKYFSVGEYQTSIKNTSDNSPVFQSEIFEMTDAATKLFLLAPDNIAIFVNNDLMSTLGENDLHRKVAVNRMFVRQEKTVSESNDDGNRNSQMRITMTNEEKPRIFQSNNFQNGGIWTLDVRHVSGSLENSAANMLRKNLSVSFGILFLLGASIVLIFISAQRAKIFAQRQIDFVSSVSHEFRTPLAVIYSAGENLADGIAKEQRQISRYGELIKSEGRKLSAMVEQILDFAGANSGKKKFVRVETNVRELVESTIAECVPILRDFRIETDFAENLPSVYADKKAISQSIQNLIGNAVKYSNCEKYLKISAQNGGGTVKISVEDKGIGIAPSDQKNIFEPFYRAKAVVDEQIHGSGLGLSLVKKTVEAHKGEISVESKLEKGSKFTIELPVAGS